MQSPEGNENCRFIDLTEPSESFESLLMLAKQLSEGKKDKKNGLPKKAYGCRTYHLGKKIFELEYKEGDQTVPNEMQDTIKGKIITYLQ